MTTPADPVDPAVRFREGVRPDGTPWITYSHPAMGSVVRLAMPNHPDFERVRVACTEAEAARHRTVIASDNSQA